MTLERNNINIRYDIGPKYLAQKFLLFITHPRTALLYISLFCILLLTYSISHSINKFIRDTLAASVSISRGIVAPSEPESSINEIYIRSGDTLSSIFYKQNIPVLEASSIIKAIKKLHPNLILHIGQKISLEYYIADNGESQEIVLKKAIISLGKAQFIEVSKANSDFIAKFVEVPLTQTLIRTSTKIKSNFVQAAKSLGLSNSNVNDLVKIYSHQIDFQRQIHKDDVLDIILEKYNTENGDFSHYGKVLYASLKLSGKEYSIYRYSHNDTDKAYFTSEGRSVRSTLLKTPVPAARITSRFGKRHHPILGYTKMHKGVDFGAPRGTKIMAAGDGTITRIGNNGAYGKFIQIRHNSTLSTAYAHASRFAKGLKRGSRVKQGQVIAFVGSTGRATGPHLHYEVRIKGKQVNPLSIKTSPGITLKGKKLDAFKSYKRKIHEIHKDLYTKREVSMVKDSLLDL